MGTSPAGREKGGYGVKLGQSAPRPLEKCSVFRELAEKREIYPPPAVYPHYARMTHLRGHDWRVPPEEGEREVGSLWARVGRVEDAVLRVVEDVRRDPGFVILAGLAALLGVLQGRALRAERWNRRLARKREMLGSEALRMNMCDRLGGVAALEAWEVRAKARLAGVGRNKAGLVNGDCTREGDPAACTAHLRRDDGREESDREESNEDATPSLHPSPSPRRRPGSPEGVEHRVIKEFALPRLPRAGGRRRRKGGRRGAARHETPSAGWPCEVMPERFRREWWEVPERGRGGDGGQATFRKRTPNRHIAHRSKFPENARGVYPGPPTSEGLGKIADVGGPRSSPGTCYLQGGGCGRGPP